MSVRIFVKIAKIIFFTIAILLLLFCLLFAILQSKWAKLQIQRQITNAFKEEGIAVHIEEVQGQLPFTWKIQEIDLHFAEESELKLFNLQLRIAILPLLKGRITIHSLKVEDAEYAFEFSKEEGTENIGKFLKQQVELLAVPYPISLNHFILNKLSLVNRTNGSTLSIGLSGSAKIQRKKREFSLDLLCFSPEENKTYFEVAAQGNRKKNFIEVSVNLHLDPIPLFFSLGVDGRLTSQCQLKGPWTSWDEVFCGLPLTNEAILGSIQGKLTETHIERFPFLDVDWSFRSSFAIRASDEIDLQTLLVSSDLIHLKGKAALYAQVEKNSAFLAFSTPSLSPFSSLLPFPIEGNSKGKIALKKGHFEASFQTQDLFLSHFAAGVVQGSIDGSVTNQEWKGNVSLASNHTALPFESSFVLEYIPETLVSVTDFQMKGPDSISHGYLYHTLDDGLYEGSLFAEVGNFEKWGSLLKEKRVAGKVTAEFTLSHKDQEQNALCVLVAKNIRFDEVLLDDFTLYANIENWGLEPRGKVNLLAEKVYTPSFYLDRLNVGIKSDEMQWPFYIDAEGRIESPFALYAKGFCELDPSLFTLELTHLFGGLAETPFSLKYPATLEWGSNYLNLSPFNFNIGRGTLFSTFELSPVRSLGKWEVHHFPLEILSCFRPRFALNGFVSAAGYIDTSSTHTEGTLNAAIEEADVLHPGKKQPLQAKGSLQAHLNDQTLQIHTALVTSDAQFLDLSASLPVNVAAYPLQISVDQTKNTSAEILSEGKLQDLFDFVNLGTSHFTGLLSCHLFLSQTLSSPLLKGQLQWQNGTYENDFTGIDLRHIDASFEARGDEIRLLDLKAGDEKSGALSAVGKLLLKPEKKFPFSLEAEMKDLHAVGFDMIDCNLTGPLYLTGDLEKMNAQGNLLVDAAKIQITESLPYEIPSMPVTYVNTPLHMTPAAKGTDPHFAFHMDLELTSEGTVKVVGRGLNAELEGNVHLYGTNTNIATNGALKLVKGEYLFSGKIFKLTDGEVVFIDKPSSAAYLNLNGTLHLPDVTVTAMLRGPLMAPQLTFQSNPQKPTSSILALILFNKDIAEISHPEAIQLASTLVSLSGGAGPDVLETIRKSIGVDRLNIASKPGSDEIAVQIGKYLTRGVLITLSQSATSSQVIVEVELSKGFIFQAETQENEEGKFSLKWRKTY